MNVHKTLLFNTTRNMIPFCEYCRNQRKVIFTGLFLIWLILLLPSFNTSQARAKQESGETLVVVAEKDKYVIGPYMEYLEDEYRLFNISDVINGKYNDYFIKNNNQNPSFGFSSSAYWFRFIIQFDENTNQDWLFELPFPLIDYMDVFICPINKPLIHKKMGYLLPFNELENTYHTHVFEAEAEPGHIIQYYIRVQCEDRIEFPLILWKKETFLSKNQHEIFVLGIYYGFILMIILLNFIIYVSIHDRAYLYYVCYSIGLVLFQASQDGFDRKYLIPDTFFGQNHYLHIVFILMGLFMLLFAKAYLHMDRYTPMLNRIFNVMILLFPLTVGTMTFFCSYSTILIFLIVYTIFFFLFLIVSGIIVLNQGYSPAYYYLVGWGILGISAIIYALKGINLIPYNFFTHSSYHIGTMLELLIQTIGLGARMNFINQEKFEVQTKMANSFRRFVPMEFLHLLNRKSFIDVQLGDQVKKKMTVLFSDIRSFTSLSEQMTPQENFDFINSYLHHIGPIIRRNSGFIDKYIGDAIMALFPDSPDDALNASIEIQAQIQIYNHERLSKKLSPISIGVGLHIGNLIMGTIGEEHRIDTTVISDTVNVSSRLEGLTKKLSTGILISKDLYEALENKNLYKTNYIGSMSIKGRIHPVEVYEVIGFLHNG